MIRNKRRKQQKLIEVKLKRLWSTISNKNVAKLNRTLSQRNNNGFVQMNDTLFLTFLLTYNSSHRNYLLPRWILFSRVYNLQQYHCGKSSFASSWETSASRERKTWPTLPEYKWAHWIDAIKRIFYESRNLYCILMISEVPQALFRFL